MNIAATSLWAEYADTVMRSVRAFQLPRYRRDDVYDPYERAPLAREDFSAMLEQEIAYPLEKQEKLRASEKLEHDTLALIRGALYPDARA